MNVKEFFYALVAAVISNCIPVKPKHWVFGSDKGETYREGSKYLLEYMLKYHPDFDCTFITQSPEVVACLRKRGVPVEFNFTLKGIYKIAIADCVFTTQRLNDIRCVYKKKNRSFYYLIHGQPFKKALKMLPVLYREQLFKQKKSTDLINRIKRVLNSEGYTYDDISFVSATSDFTAELLRKEYIPKVGIRVLGMPRNDVLFDDERMKNEKWNQALEGKFVITYMPTHRKYGSGQLSQTPFYHREDVQQWMREHNVILLVKQHPNMVHKLSILEETDVIRNISKSGYDPQVVIYHSDILITDYSSVWMDFLLLRRPLLFYFYDSFEEDDAGCYYSLRDEFPKNWCESEDDLFEMIKGSYEDKSLFTPLDFEVKKFHKYIDNKSCERYYREITRMKYGEE